MRKGLLGLIFPVLLTGCSTFYSIERKIEQGTYAHNFSSDENASIKSAVRKVEGVYPIDFKMFFLEDTNLVTAATMRGYVESNQELIPKEFDKSDFLNYWLVILKDSEDIECNFEKDEAELWNVLTNSGYESTIVHEIGHIFYLKTNIDKRNEFCRHLINIDQRIPEESKELIGHPSWSSYFFRFHIGDEMNWEMKYKFSSEQFAELFCYAVFDCNYQDNDKLFREKMITYKELMENFERKK